MSGILVPVRFDLVARDGATTHTLGQFDMPAVPRIGEGVELPTDPSASTLQVVDVVWSIGDHLAIVKVRHRAAIAYDREADVPDIDY